MPWSGVISAGTERSWNNLRQRDEEEDAPPPQLQPQGVGTLRPFLIAVGSRLLWNGLDRSHAFLRRSELPAGLLVSVPDRRI